MAVTTYAICFRPEGPWAGPVPAVEIGIHQACPTWGAGLSRPPGPRHDEVRERSLPHAPSPSVVRRHGRTRTRYCPGRLHRDRLGPAAARQCGSARTAANVRVLIEISHGPVDCPTAVQVEQDYAAALAEGKAPGNGGGGPVSVSGWTCLGFDTPQVLRTGQTSKCTKDNSEILAVLAPAPS